MLDAASRTDDNIQDESSEMENDETWVGLRSKIFPYFSDQSDTAKNEMKIKKKKKFLQLPTPMSLITNFTFSDSHR